MINDKAIFSVDVEEWFHLLDTTTFSQNISEWDMYTARITETFIKLLDIIDAHDTKVTCFFVGWIAEKYPELVKLAYDKGHEIGIHGYYHRLAYNQTYDEFYTEVFKAKNLVESIINDKVYGFRAPAFSIKEQNIWVYKILMELGFTYSSSIYPPRYKEFGIAPKIIHYKKMKLTEIPLSVLKPPFTSLSCFGGGYFRLFPLWWYNIATQFVKDQPLTFYIHPRDIDLKHPTMKLSIKRRFKSTFNIKSTQKKIERILSQKYFVPFSAILKDLGKENLQQITLCKINDKETAKYHFLKRAQTI